MIKNFWNGRLGTKKKGKNYNCRDENKAKKIKRFEISPSQKFA